ncbi:MAG: (d)CMP kinase [Anaerolineales bacterium]
MTTAKIIAIDGPAAAGKSTLAQALAASLEYLYFDTGVMYRAVTLAVLRQGKSIEDEADVSTIAQSLNLDVLAPSNEDGRPYDVIMDGEDVTWAIRTPEIDAKVSKVSMYPGVRAAMTIRQREIGMRGEVVMVGRDIGTVVLPEADLKIYLDASVEERALRRYKECMARGEHVDFDEILVSMRARDRLDSTRELAPLKAADDAIIVNNSELDEHEVLLKVLELVDADLDADDTKKVTS